MFRTIKGLAGCVGGKHERSDRHIEQNGDHYVSRCAHCGVRMRRRAKRDWVVERTPS